MPLVDVTLIEGRTTHQLRALVGALTQAVVSSIDAPKDTVQVILRELPATHWAAGDVTVAEKKAGQPRQA